MHLLDKGILAGKNAFGPSWSPASAVAAPGRLELLGNHVDYSGGLVLAGAVDRTVVVAIADGPNSGTISLVAPDVDDSSHTIRVSDCANWKTAGGPTGPAEYLRGVVASLLARDIDLHDSLQLAIVGDIPLGFGMSSSAALCVSLVLALAVDELAPRTIVEVAREAEHRAGSPVGAMDQSASVAGGVILFNGAETSFEAIEPNLGDYVFAVADSGVRHALGESSYPTRVAESTQALTWLRQHGFPELEYLALLEPGPWSEARATALNDLGSTLVRRVDHVVSEVARVRVGVQAIASEDWIQFGELMSASGNSSAMDYEISHPLVEELVHLVREQEGVLGARMMGGGEGGPALALIHRDAIDTVRERLESDFFRLHASEIQGDRFQQCVFGPGARVLDLNQD